MELIEKNDVFERKSDFLIPKFALKVCRINAKLIGLWPMNFNTSPVQKTIKFFLNILCSCVLSFVLISSLLFGTFILRKWNQRLLLLGPTSFIVMTLTKYILLMCNSKKIIKCLQFMENDWKKIEDENQLKLMTENARIGHYLTFISALFMYTGGVWYNFDMIRPIWHGSVTKEANVTLRVYPAPVYGKFFTDAYSPIYEIVFLSHLFNAFIIYATTVTSLALSAVFSMHACGQFDVVVLHLNNLISGNKEKKYWENDFKNTVKRHLQVLSLISHMEDLLSGVCFTEVVGNTLNLCLLGYYAITALKQADADISSVTCFLLLMSFLFNISIYCFIGELLTTKASKIGESAYNTEWYLFPKEVSLGLILIIREAQFPSKITAGKIIILSMTTLSTVIRSAGAYFNVLWNITK